MTDATTQPQNTLSLEELDGLASGLGDTIHKLLESHSNYARFLEVKGEVDRLLGNADLSPKEVYVEKGSAKGLTVQGAFEACSREYQFDGQLDL